MNLLQDSVIYQIIMVNVLILVFSIILISIFIIIGLRYLMERSEYWHSLAKVLISRRWDNIGVFYHDELITSHWRLVHGAKIYDVGYFWLSSDGEILHFQGVLTRRAVKVTVVNNRSWIFYHSDIDNKKYHHTYHPCSRTKFTRGPAVIKEKKGVGRKMRFSTVKEGCYQWPEVKKLKITTGIEN